MSVGGSREVYREEGISKEMNTEGHSGSGEEPGKTLGKRTRCVGHQPLAGYRVSGEQRPLSAGRFRTVFPEPALDALILGDFSRLHQWKRASSWPQVSSQ